MNVSVLCLTYIFSCKSCWMILGIRDLLVFNKVTGREKIQSTFIQSHTIFNWTIIFHLITCIEWILPIWYWSLRKYPLLDEYPEQGCKLDQHPGQYHECMPVPWPSNMLLVGIGPKAGFVALWWHCPLHDQLLRHTALPLQPLSPASPHLHLNLHSSLGVYILPGSTSPPNKGLTLCPFHPLYILLTLLIWEKPRM